MIINVYPFMKLPRKAITRQPVNPATADGNVTVLVLLMLGVVPLETVVLGQYKEVVNTVVKVSVEIVTVSIPEVVVSVLREEECQKYS